MQIMQIWYIAYLTMEWKAYGLALFSTNFSNLWLKAVEILWSCTYTPIPFVNHIFNVFINIYEYANQIICKCNKGIIGLCLSFNLVLSLEV